MFGATSRDRASGGGKRGKTAPVPNSKPSSDARRGGPNEENIQTINGSR